MFIDNFMIEEEFNKEHRDDYFAWRARYRTYVDNNGTHEDLIKDDIPTFFMLSKDGKTIFKPNDTGKKDIIEKFMFLPAMQLKKKDVTFCQAQAGTGKSYALDNFVQIYKMLYPENQVLYFSLNLSDIDTSLTKKWYRFIDMKVFCDLLEEISENLNELKEMSRVFANKLLIFDDVGKIKASKKQENLLWTFINSGCEDLRKVNTMVYCIMHTSRTGFKGSCLKEEMNRYLIFPKSIQSLNDRVIDAVFNFKSKLKKRIFDTDARFVAIDCIRKLVVSPTEIYMLPLWDDE